MNTDPLILLKRSLEKDKVPTLGQLGLGELAINHYDGRVYVRQDTLGQAGITTRVVQVGAAASLGKTYFVALTGDDNNTGLNEIDALRTIKAASLKAIPGDTIKVAPGTFVENNPITLRKNVSVEGYELRNCLVTPQNPDQDLFYTSDGVHLTDLSFVGQPSTNGAAVVAFPPLLGVAGDRYFDAARLLRFNADFIAREAVGFLTSGYSGLAGSHRAQDAARLLDINKDFIAKEAVGFLTSGYSGYAGSHRSQDAARLIELNLNFIAHESVEYINSSDFAGALGLNATQKANCKDDVKDVLRSVVYDLRATGNEKSIGAALSYFPSNNQLAHITGAGVSQATIAAFDYAAGIATHVINNYPWAGITSTTTNVYSFDYTPSTGIATVITTGNIGFSSVGEVVRLAGLAFTCPSGSGITTTVFPDHTRGDTYTVTAVGVGSTTFTINVGTSTITHTYNSGGTVTYLKQYSNLYDQVFVDSVERVNFGCVGVANTIKQLVGIVTSTISAGTTAGLPTVVQGINLYTSDCEDDLRDIITAVSHDLKANGNIRSVGAAQSYFVGGALAHITGAGISEQTIDTLEYMADIMESVINTRPWGTIPSGLVKDISGFDYTASTGIATVTAVGHGVTTGNIIKLAGIAFTCPGGSGITTTIFPDGTQGSFFEVKQYLTNNTIKIFAGISTIDHTYVSGGTLQKYDNFQEVIQQDLDNSVIQVRGGCVGVANTIRQLVGIVTQAIGVGNTNSLPGITTGIRLNMEKCFRDVKYAVKAICYDITRGGNTRSVSIGKTYFDANGNKLNILVDPDEYDQTVIALNYSKDIARAVINNVVWGSKLDPTWSRDFAGGLEKIDITNVVYDKSTGITTITTSVGHGLTTGNPVKLAGIAMTCPGYDYTGIGITGFQYNKTTGLSTVFLATNHFVNEDDLIYLENIEFNCGDSGLGPIVNITNAVYDKTVGILTVTTSAASGVHTGEPVQLKNITFTCPGGSGITTTIFPDGSSPNSIYGTDVFTVSQVNSTTQFQVNVGVSTINHTYSSGGTAQAGVTTTIFPDGTQGYFFRVESTPSASSVIVNVGVSTINHTYVSGGTMRVGFTTTIFPDGTLGPLFPVKDYINSTQFTVVTGISTINHTYVSGGTIAKQTPFQNYMTQIRDLSIQDDVLTGYNNTINSCANVISAVNTCVGVITSIIDQGFDAFESPSNPTGIVTTYQGNNGAGSFIPNDPSFSAGTDGPVFKGPYIRNCTNFIQDSIGMRINGFDAEPGDQDEIGVQGSMSVDSFTQYNQGGIGVSITNGAYAQLVSIFTICCDEAIVTATGGQCDLTNSNASFGNKGLVARGVGDQDSSSIYRLTAEVVDEVPIGGTRVVLSGVGTQRPYDGQTIYFDQLYQAVEAIRVVDGGSGYTGPAPKITIASPTGPDGITAQAIPIIVDGVIESILVANSGNQYVTAPSITVDPPDEPDGRQAVVEVERMALSYFKVAEATLPYAGISTVTLKSSVPTKISKGATAFITRQSLQIATTISFEYIGAGTNILTARPSVGGVTIQANEVVMEDGGLVVYTSTDQAGNFNIGDGITIDQATGTLSGRVYIKSLFNNVTPFILALGG